MKDRETLDEAIDRVASRMSLGHPEERLEIAPVWQDAGSVWWTRWRLAGVLGVAVVLLSMAGILRQPSEPRPLLASSDSWASAVWSPFPAPSADSRAALVNAPRAADGRQPARFARVAEASARPAWGIPFIEPPAALVLPPLDTPAIDVEAAGVGALDVPPFLLTGPESGSDALNSKEQ